MQKDNSYKANSDLMILSVKNHFDITITERAAFVAQITSYFAAFAVSENTLS